VVAVVAIGEAQVVAQTAPQCFDISLWQLVSALLVGLGGKAPAKLLSLPQVVEAAIAINRTRDLRALGFRTVRPPRS
jgi:hypothetical protein